MRNWRFQFGKREFSSRQDLPMLDITHLLLSVRMQLKRHEMGDVVRHLMNGERWSAEEQTLITQAEQGLPGDRIETRALLLLAWLRHVTSNISKSSRFERHSLWIAKNVEAVLECV